MKEAVIVGFLHVIMIGVLDSIRFHSEYSESGTISGSHKLGFSYETI